MNEEDKKRLKAELCRRLPYGPKGTVRVKIHGGSREQDTTELRVKLVGVNTDSGRIEVVSADPAHPDCDISNTALAFEDFVPILRPMSSRTEEEKEHLQSLQDIITDENYGDSFSPAAWHTIAEWNTYCDERHLDWTGLIGRELATTEQNT